mmetsp:Transcript_35784/g.57866  ORF Transcript_35784/g.57866 Transcript_35784/m.57866 type:complete len:199 (-) Transcript_35784:139-735(-)
MSIVHITVCVHKFPRCLYTCIRIFEISSVVVLQQPPINLAPSSYHWTALAPKSHSASLDSNLRSSWFQTSPRFGYTTKGLVVTNLADRRRSETSPGAVQLTPTANAYGSTAVTQSENNSPDDTCIPSRQQNDTHVGIFIAVSLKSSPKAVASALHGTVSNAIPSTPAFTKVRSLLLWKSLSSSMDALKFPVNSLPSAR